MTLSININLISSWWGDQRPASPEPAPPGTAPPEPPQKQTAIHATETDFVELGLALHAADVYPGETQEKVMDRMRQESGYPLAHWEQLGANIRRRGKLTFLYRLINSLEERNKEIEENGRANKRPKFGQK